jgi:diketogulonate reductase-like aldo/keto reductase
MHVRKAAAPPLSGLPLTRRRLLQCLAGAVAGALLSGPLRAETPRMRTRPIPKGGEALPVIGLGTYRTFDVRPGAYEPLAQVLREFVRRGGQVIDSSPMYGRAEAVVGELAARNGVADRLFYATKVWTQGREAGIAQMEQSAQRMGAARMDLMQIHNLVDWRTHLKTLRAWKEEGRIRYLGITHYHRRYFDELARILRTEPIDFVQLPYSIDERAAEHELLPLAQERGVAVLVNRPFQQGALFRATRGRPLPEWAAEFDCASWAQFFLKFIVSHPAVTCVIPATSNPKHLVDNMQAGYGRLPDEATRERMAAELS